MPPEQTPSSPAPQGTPGQNLSIPIAIVIAGAIVGGAIFLVAGDTPRTTTSPTGAEIREIPGVTASDHLFGNPDAPIKIVEYIDLECPFCKQFHNTMKEVMAAYPGKVAWVMRNFPLQQLHPNASTLALAAECVAELRGNDAYWRFIDSVFTQAPINTYFDMTKLTPTAEGVGVSGAAFDACVESGKYQEKISTEFDDAIAAGGQGTPFSVLITEDGTHVPIPGSQPYQSIKTLIDTALRS